MTSTTRTDNEIRNASYDVAAELTKGMTITLTQDAYYGQQYHAGETFTVISVSNAGFRGMEVFGQDAAGDYVTFSAGIVRAV